jgi:hypothetical protein
VAIRLGQAGQQRTQEMYAWNVKGDFFTDHYETVLKQNRDRPLDPQPIAPSCKS